MKFLLIKMSDSESIEIDIELMSFNDIKIMWLLDFGKIGID